jgi:hypothetical protein
VFLLNSRHPLVCATPVGLRRQESRFFRSYAGNLPSSFDMVPPTPWDARPVHLCRFRVRSIASTVSRTVFTSHPNPIRDDTDRRSSCLAGPGMLTWFPSATAFALALGAGSPCADWPCAGTLGLSAGEVLAPLIATHVRIRTRHRSTAPHRTASSLMATLRYRAASLRRPWLRRAA